MVLFTHCALTGMGANVSGGRTAARFTASTRGKKWIRVVSAVAACALFVAVASVGGTTNAVAVSSVTVIATIPVGADTHGIVVNAATNTIYTVSDGGYLSVISGETNKVIKTLRVGHSSLAIALNGTTNTIYVRDEATVTVIDGATNTVVKAFPLPSSLGYASSADLVAVDDSSGAIYVADTNNAMIYEFDAITNDLVGTIELTSGSNPRAMAIDPKTHTLFVADNNLKAVLQISEATNTIVGSFRVWGTPSGIAIDAVTGAVVVSNNGDNSISIARRVDDTYFSTRISLGSGWNLGYFGPTSIAVDSSTGSVYVTQRTMPGGVVKIDESTGAVDASLAWVGISPYGIAVNPVTGRIYTTSITSGTVSVIAQGIPPSINAKQAWVQPIVGIPYSAAITVTGGIAPYTWAVVTDSTSWITPGLSLNPLTGILSGTPTEEGNTGFVVTVTDAVGAFAMNYVQHVVAATGTLSTVTPTITGTKKVGSTLSATPGTWGPAPVTLAYQWYRTGVAITGATAKTYKLTAGDLGKTMTVKVRGSKTRYTSVTRGSAATTPVAKGTLTSPTPTITGIQRSGYTLTANPGTWGPAPVKLTYRWYRSGVPIAWATAQKYKLVPADRHDIIKVRVLGSKTAYTSVVRYRALTVKIP